MFNLGVNKLTAGIPKVSVETSSRSASKDSACVRCQMSQSVSCVHIYTYYEYVSLCKIRKEFTQCSETLSYRSSDINMDLCQSRFWKVGHVFCFSDGYLKVVCCSHQVWDSHLSDVVNTRIFVLEILLHLHLLVTWFYERIMHVGSSKSHTQRADRCVSQKVVKDMTLLL